MRTINFLGSKVTSLYKFYKQVKVDMLTGDPRSILYPLQIPPRRWADNLYLDPFDTVRYEQRTADLDLHRVGIVDRRQSEEESFRLAERGFDSSFKRELAKVAFKNNIKLIGEALPDCHTALNDLRRNGIDTTTVSWVRVAPRTYALMSLRDYKIYRGRSDVYPGANTNVIIYRRLAAIIKYHEKPLYVLKITKGPNSLINILERDYSWSRYRNS